MLVANGNLNIAQYLIREEHCNPSCENNNGDTPLHYACDNGHLNIAQYLIREEHCNPSCENKYGNGHHFTMLVVITTPTLYNICCQLDESIH